MTRRKGYILPMSLALVAMAAAVLARVCRQEMRQSLDVARRADELQQHWGMLSCQVCYLREVEAVLQSAESATGRAAPAVRAVVQLGGRQFVMLFADESAKLNLNMIYRHSDAAATEHLVRAESLAAKPPLTVRLRPLKRGARLPDDEHAPPAFGGFGQIFDQANGAPAMAIQSASRNITCWGSGKINWRRASFATLTEALNGDRQAAGQIVALQKPGKAGAPRPLTQALQSTAGGAKRAEELFTDSSDSQSLWITCGDDNSSIARLIVREARDDGHAKIATFTWQP